MSIFYSCWMVYDNCYYCVLYLASDFLFIVSMATFLGVVL